MAREFEFDLRKLNPKEGDLILLINRDSGGDQKNLLAVFNKFIESTEATRGTTAVRLSKVAQLCDFSAKKAAYLRPCLKFDKINLPKIEDLPSYMSYDVNYIPKEGYVGADNVIKALKKEKGYEVYADILRCQLNRTAGV